MLFNGFVSPDASILSAYISYAQERAKLGIFNFCLLTVQQEFQYFILIFFLALG